MKLLDLPVSTLPRFVFLPFLSLQFLFLPKCVSLISSPSCRFFSLSCLFQPPPLLSPLSRCDSSHISMHRVHAFYYPSGLK